MRCDGGAFTTPAGTAHVRDGSALKAPTGTAHARGGGAFTDPFIIRLLREAVAALRRGFIVNGLFIVFLFIFLSCALGRSLDASAENGLFKQQRCDMCFMRT